MRAWDKDNKRLVREFDRRWEEYEARLSSNYKPLTKQERWALREVMTNVGDCGFGAVSSTAGQAQAQSPQRGDQQVEGQQAGACVVPCAVACSRGTRHRKGRGDCALEAELKAEREKPAPPPDSAEIARLKARIAGLEADATRSRFSGRGYIMPKKQFMNLRFCLHSDHVARLKDEGLTKRFEDAARTLTEFADVLVNEEAEQRQKRSDAFWATAHWKRDEVLRKKAAAKHEARSAAAKAAAAKRAAKKAAPPG